MLRFNSALLGALVTLVTAQSFALSEPFPAYPAGTLFSSDEVLNIEVTGPLKELFDNYSEEQENSEDRLKLKGDVSYTDKAGKKITIPVKFRVKGHSTTNCEFKKVELIFKKDGNPGTLFAGMKTLDLNTHCELDEVKNTHREALIYRFAKVLKVPTFQARPLLVRYHETGFKKVDNATKPFGALFVEDKGDLLRRLNVKEVKFYREDGFDPDVNPAPTDGKELYVLESMDRGKHPQIDPEDMERLHLFNAMIGNSDFMYPSGSEASSGLWNIKLIAMDANHWVPLTHDFNLSETMEYASEQMPPYAYEFVDTAANLRIRKSFLSKKDEILGLVKTLKDDKKGQEIFNTTLKIFFGGL